MALLLLLALVELLLAEALLGSVLVGLDLLGQLQLTVDLCVYLLLKFTHLLTTIRRWYSIYWWYIVLCQSPLEILGTKLLLVKFMKVKSSPSENNPKQKAYHPLLPLTIASSFSFLSSIGRSTCNSRPSWKKHQTVTNLSSIPSF